MRRLIDSHVHMESFEDSGSIIHQSKIAGIEAIICVGGSLSSSIFAKNLARKNPDYIFPALGVHPSEVLKENIDASIEYMRENLDGCIAVGEIGLDYAYTFAKPNDVRQKMRDIYMRFLEIASDFNLPVSVHSRSAYKDSLNLAVEAGVSGVFHWYDGPVHILEMILDAGFFVSATPSIEYSKGARLVMDKTPIERILVETDSPVFLRKYNRRSTPVDVKLVVDVLAELKGMEPEEVSAVTARNTENLFRIS